MLPNMYFCTGTSCMNCVGICPVPMLAWIIKLLPLLYYFKSEFQASSIFILMTPSTLTLADPEGLWGHGPPFQPKIWPLAHIGAPDQYRPPYPIYKCALKIKKAPWKLKNNWKNMWFVVVRSFINYVSGESTFSLELGPIWRPSEICNPPPFLKRSCTLNPYPR
jgi:hypothetical protein